MLLIHCLFVFLHFLVILNYLYSNISNKFKFINRNKFIINLFCSLKKVGELFISPEFLKEQYRFYYFS